METNFTRMALVKRNGYSGKNANVDFVAGLPELFMTTSRFAHSYFKHINEGDYGLVSFSYNRLTSRRRVIRVTESGGFEFAKSAVADLASSATAKNPDYSDIAKLAFAVHPDFREDFGSLCIVHDGALTQTEANALLDALVPTKGSKPKSSPKLTKEALAGGEGMAPRKRLTGHTIIEGFHIKKASHALFDAVAAKAKAQGAANVLLLGPSGSGKTSYPQAYAKANKMDFFKLDTALVSDPEEFFGKREASGGTTFFSKSPFLEAIEKGNVVVLLDEINRVQPWIANGLFGFLDDTRKSGEFEVGENVLFCGAMNVGSKFTGTFMLDAALMNRFTAAIQFGYPPAKIEEKIVLERVKDLTEEVAKGIVEVITALRKFEAKEELDIDVSVRTTLRIAEMYTFSEMDLRSVISFTVGSFITEPEAEKNMWDEIGSVLDALHI